MRILLAFISPVILSAYKLFRSLLTQKPLHDWEVKYNLKTAFDFSLVGNRVSKLWSSMVFRGENRLEASSSSKVSVTACVKLDLEYNIILTSNDCFIEPCRERDKEISKVELMDIVALSVELPQYNLRRGQVGTVVQSSENEEIFEVEFSTPDGRTYQSLSLAPNQFTVLRFNPEICLA